jgi:dynein heavy chain, axonemal
MIGVDTLAFDFVVQPSADDSVVQEPPKEGAYIKSLIIEGAQWDYEIMGLADAEPMMLYSQMPVIYFRPMARRKGAGGSTDKSYECPIYMYPVRSGSRERPSFVIWVDLKSGEHTGGFWIKRGTAMLLGTGM